LRPPHPLFEVEHLGLRAEPEAQEKLWREQRHMLAGGAIHFDEVALSEILDPSGVKGHHLCASVPGMFQESARTRPRQWLTRRYAPRPRHFIETTARPFFPHPPYVIRGGRRKFKRMRHQTKGARDWFDRVRRANPTLFAHWTLCHGNGRTSGAV
jgi:hypothetical protein